MFFSAVAGSAPARANTVGGVRICIAYDCLYPFTVGGHERWLRQLAESLAAAGHEVTFLTRTQWARGDAPQIPGVRVVAVSRREDLYDEKGNRHPMQAIRFALGVLAHLARRRGSYDLVHTCAFPYFHLIALRLALSRTGVPVTVDWPEVWSRTYWRRYSGLVSGSLGEALQWLCVRLTPHAVVYSRTHGDRLAALGLASKPFRPGGLGPDPRTVAPWVEPAGVPVVVFAGRHIREKRAGLVIEAAAIARRRVPDLHAVVLGDGPETPTITALAAGAGDWAEVPGFVSRDRVEREIRDAAVFLLPSEREGFGIVVLEATSVGTPVVVVAGPDNASVELIEPGVNGFVAADADAETVAAAIVLAVEAGVGLRRTSADWYAENSQRLASSATAHVLGRHFVELTG